jgi:hypothetical protein
LANDQGNRIKFQILAYFRIRLWATQLGAQTAKPRLNTWKPLAGLKITSPKQFSRNEKRVANYAPYGLAAPIQQKQKRFANFMLKVTE